MNMNRWVLAFLCVAAATPVANGAVQSTSLSLEAAYGKERG
jgi:hypothetical protein